MKARKTPMRMCVGCREMKDKRELIRIVRSPEGTVSLDPVGKKPGRGAYVCPRVECLRRAIKQRQLERQLDITLSDEVKEGLADALAAAEKAAAAEKVTAEKAPEEAPAAATEKAAAEKAPAAEKNATVAEAAHG